MILVEDQWENATVSAPVAERNFRRGEVREPNVSDGSSDCVDSC